MDIKTIKPSNFYAAPRQAARLEDRKNEEAYEIERRGMKIVVNSGVYQTSGDSDLFRNRMRYRNSFVSCG